VTSPGPDVAQKLPLHDMGALEGEAATMRRKPLRADRRLAWVILLAFCTAFSLKVAGGLDAPFSYEPVTSSVDAYNGATWSTGARALRESGPIDSKFGAVWSGRAGDYRYADHPPLIYPATALAQWLVPDDELGGRLLVFLASIVATVLLYLLLRGLRLAPVLAAASVGIGLSVPMFLTYGTMLDTLMLGLPFAAWYLLLWQRSLEGRASRVGLASAAAAVSLVAWEGVILVAATVLVTVAVRRDRERLRAIAVAGLGAAAAVVVTVLWQVWVYGGLAQVLDQAALRAGGSGFSLGEYLHRQWSSTREMFGIPAMAVFGAGVIALVFNRRFRPVGVAALGASIAYAIGFREGSFIHDYWNYWMVITLVLGIGAIASRLSRFRRPEWLLAAGLLATGLVLFGFHVETYEATLRRVGERQAQREPGLTRPAEGQRWVPLVALGATPGGARGDGSSPGSPGSTAAWVLPQARFYFGVPLRFATTNEAVSYARRHPDAWIVLNYGSVGGGELLRGEDAAARLG
jgi:4-amino-4-deoxy-L-arabinose transferase-like glycosyltransferase